MQGNVLCLGIGLWTDLGLGSSGKGWGMGHKAAGIWGMEAGMSMSGSGSFAYHKDRIKPIGNHFPRTTARCSGIVIYYAH